MDDLDSLLADLGRPSTKGDHDNTATVNLTELDDLMSDLNDGARAAPKAAPSLGSARPAAGRAAATAAPKPASAPAPAAAPKAAVDDLDDLLNDLTVGSKSTGGGSSSSKAATDDLDSLLNDLDTHTGRPPQSSQQPQQQSRPAPQAVSQPPRPTPAAAAPVSVPPPKATPKPATVAVDDLDDLLNGLDTPSSAPPTSYSSPAPRTGGGGSAADEVDEMFRDINSGARSAAGAPPPRATGYNAPVGGPSSGPSRGMCGGCNQPIHGEVLQSMGKYWHIEHFCCGNCQQNLGTQPFFEYEGMPHCEKCYKGLFCPRCAKCDKSITDRIITAMGKKWHPDCFTCSTCNKPFPGGSFFERDGYPYCSDHFYSNSIPNCGSCNKPVRGECTNAMNQSWHVECFVCQYCRKAFTDGAFFEHEGKPYCKLHYHANAGSVCGGCQKAITGRSVNAMGKNWHPEHFTCAFCVNPLSGGNYTEKQGKPYCSECYQNLFG